MVKLLELTNDYVFKRNFGYKGNEEITKVLLEDIIRTNIENVNLDSTPITEKDILDEKLGIMDIKAVLDNTMVCNIEIQIVKQKDIVKRLLFYWSKMYAREINSGEQYSIAKKTISILIADFELEELRQIKKYITRWNLREEDFPKKILTEVIDVYIIELPKVEKYVRQEKYKNLDLWVKFIKNPEVFEMSKKENNDQELQKTIKAIESAKKNLEKISADEHERELARLRDKHIRDQKSIFSTGFEDGQKDGLKRGEKKGLEKGLKQGKYENQKETAKKMLEENIDMEVIIRITGLTKEEIEELK
ncbi:MAG: Rpn family recombination-promoting nuclease/putative transposase [Clostridia bacterium]|nr:Rpn family recombination-promoting nuclease/putative transposase [Clostridia bacterium]MBP3800525.1 Rpn family recombination-promoting nuclease/putative transposase [Clostridia bacterium]